jgi:oxaloacetate decarboxylase alpha subunit
VTPTSQIVGVQAVLNVLAGKRYEMVTQETRDYVKGLYGRSPAPLDAKIAKKILNGEKPITCRPADLLKPGLAAAAKELDPKLIQKEEDIISYCMFPEVALGYFKWRAKPADQREPIPADLENKKAAAPAPAAPATAEVKVEDDTLKFAEIGKLVAGLASRLGFAAGSMPMDIPAMTAAPAAAATTPVAAPVQEKKDAVVAGPTINAPLNGTFFRTAGPGKPNLAEEGASLKAGDPLCIVEAMKLFNQIKADKPLKIVKFLVEHGSHVTKGQPMAVVQY